MPNSRQIAILQLQSVDCVQTNLKQIENLLSPLKRDERTTLVCLPENSLYMRLKEGASIPGLRLQDSCFSWLAEVARQKNLLIHLGSVPLHFEHGLTNCSVVIRPDGSVTPSYQKIHLFNIELDGQKPVRESDVFRAGTRASVFEYEGTKWGESICYDLRFSELYSKYAEAEVDGVLIPAAFLQATGEAHWHVLIRARAIESQCFVVAAAQAGHHRSENGERFTFGHSMVVDPWGRILVEGSGDQPELLVTTIDADQVKRVRVQIPMQKHRVLRPKT